MNVSWKASAIAGAAAFLLSVIVGALGGVAFGALLLRAVMSAAVFAGGAVGVRILIHKYLPELIDNAAPSPEVGGTIDMVVDDEVDTGSEAVGGSDEDVQAPADDEDAAAEDAAAEDADADVDGELPADDGVEELPRARADAEIDDEAGGDQTASDDQAGELVEEVDDAAGTAASLPDLGTYADSFASGPSELSDEPSGGDDAGDAGVMAKAIRTVLKRDE